jgi:D-alanyl-D-alanine carboxypeptidase
VITPTTEATAPASPNDLLYIVDKQHTLSASYVPPDLVPLTTVRTTTPKQMVRRVVLPHLEKLIADAKAAGFELAVTSAYRSYSEQEATHAYWVRIEGEAAADRVSAQAGQSEHQLGLALDLTSAGAGFILSENFGSLPEGKWLRENAHRYGFIIRYPEGKESVTGYAYEPWHIRYVGEEAATAIFQQGITLDEYMRSKR